MIIQYKYSNSKNIEGSITVCNARKTDLAIVVAILQLAFNQIDVIDGETGEIYFSRYESWTTFKPCLSEGKAIDKVQEILDD